MECFCKRNKKNTNFHTTYKGVYKSSGLLVSRTIGKLPLVVIVYLAWETVCWLPGMFIADGDTTPYGSAKRSPQQPHVVNREVTGSTQEGDDHGWQILGGGTERHWQAESE